MRIVHVSDCFAPRVGGIETQVGDLAAHQVAAGHEVHVLTATAEGDGAAPPPLAPGGAPVHTAWGEREELASGVVVHRITSRVTRGLPVTVNGSSRIATALRELRPDVVHVQAGMVSPFAYQGASVARRLRLPLAITWHCMLDGIRTPLHWGARATGWNAGTAALSAVSEVAASRVRAVFGDGAHEVGILPNGIEVATWAPPAGSHEITGAAQSSEGGLPLRVVSTQRVAPRKRTGVIVDVAEEVSRRLGPDAVHFTIAGGGPELADTRHQVERRGLSGQVDLLGRVPREDLPALYRERDVFLSPSRLEAFGIAALEGRTAGLAVVALEGTGITTFVRHGEEGLIAADDHGLAEAIVQLAQDRALLGRIREHNASVPPRTDWADVVAAAAGEYERAAHVAARTR
ncbi:glycosyltransferase family 4 protein [Serinibacter salmoneus]|uniref:D-inositol 3-phosphate glycosyltransferase n=1 Tax=Serinibacter salmoneus TaxID=556530 RepID=A0A2A9CXZ4_9MICO|nr:glycosyltransferase family 4 protein [Serinibacter salmoneus]PFG19006.1 glycosyltransferase involved in cell wall biosynthesis [Serinibacter salmoneus]